MLREVGADGVVLGHSERRTYFGETDEALARQAAGRARRRPAPDPLRRARPRRSATRTRPRTCCDGRSRPTWRSLRDARLVEVVIAYEPVWAIGTGPHRDPRAGRGAIGFIRSLIASRSEDAAAAMRIVYGGSVKPDNAAELLGRPEIDGALVGGASLDPEAIRRDRRGCGAAAAADR